MQPYPRLAFSPSLKQVSKLGHLRAQLILLALLGSLLREGPGLQAQRGEELGLGCCSPAAGTRWLHPAPAPSHGLSGSPLHMLLSTAVSGAPSPAWGR